MKKTLTLLAALSCFFTVGCKSDGSSQKVESYETNPISPIKEPVRLSTPKPVPSVAQQAPALQPEKPILSTPQPAGQGGTRVHTVKKRDTLWSLSRKYLGNPKRFDEILAANPSLNGDPKNLKPGQKLIIP